MLNKHYMCGNNSFGQVSAARIAADASISEGTPESHLCYCHPVQVQPCEHVTFTWSQAWCIDKNGSLTCYGFHSDTWTNMKPSSVCAAMATKSGVMIQAADGFVRHYLENGEFETVTVAGVSPEAVFQGATNTKVYCLQRTQLSECHLDESKVTGCEYRLGFSDLLPRVSVTHVACGLEHTLILTEGGQVMSCGSCSRGQLGHGEVSVDAVLVPRVIQTFQGVNIIAIATGGWHSVGLSDAGDMYVWGWNESGQLGLPCSDRSDPQRANPSGSLHQDLDSIHIQPEPYGLDLPDDLQVVMVTCGSRHTEILTADHKLYSTGWNKYGQLCLSDTHYRDCLTRVTWFDQRGELVQKVSAGAWNTFVVTVMTNVDCSVRM
ncbi:hypothetical protein DPMN_165984 [Dreissena polymorpha]|uniref:Uncharacterized protein n=1 Tax=Dreissena polymorpha TaxID=45954 RepID=A0A9D4EXV8_DREPO|nr:hypothetical protein DPMN_165984 [Dreissena polymorpha]